MERKRQREKSDRMYKNKENIRKETEKEENGEKKKTKRKARKES